MRIEEIDIKKIELLENIRQKQSNEDLNELMTSIKDVGLMQPIGVQETNEGYILIWGYRRLLACKKLGLRTIQATIFLDKNETMSEEDFLIYNVTENIHRKATNMVELGRVCFMLRKTLSSSEIASRLSISKKKVDLAIDTFAKVPSAVRDKVISFGNGNATSKKGFLSAGASSQIVHLRNITKKDRDDIFEWVRKEEKSMQQIHVLGSLLADGMTLKRATKEVDNYVVKAVTITLRKDLIEPLCEKTQGGFKGYIRELIRKQNPNMLF